MCHKRKLIIFNHLIHRRPTTSVRNVKYPDSPAFARSAGSELRKPLGAAMVGGLILSQILTLYTTPVIYLYLDRAQRWLTSGQRAKLPRLAVKMGS